MYNSIEPKIETIKDIPATIAENAGHDPLDTVLSMRHAVQQGDLEYGPDVTNGGIHSMKEEDVIEPMQLIKQAMLSATEVTTSILRIDDIVSRRPVE